MLQQSMFMKNLEKQDYKLLVALKDNSKSAFDALYKLYWKILYDYALKISGTTEDAEELVQEVFISLWINRSKIEITESLNNYLIVSLKYKFLDKIRKEKRFEEFAETISKQAVELFDKNAEEELIFEEGRNYILKKVNILPDKCKEIFLLKKVENYTVAEISDKLLITPQTVKNQLTKANKMMQPYMKEFASLLSS